MLPATHFTRLPCKIIWKDFRGESSVGTPEVSRGHIDKEERDSTYVMVPVTDHPRRTVGVQ
jgi:hypothetical protein